MAKVSECGIHVPNREVCCMQSIDVKLVQVRSTRTNKYRVDAFAAKGKFMDSDFLNVVRTIWFTKWRAVPGEMEKCPEAFILAHPSGS